LKDKKKKHNKKVKKLDEQKTEFIQNNANPEWNQEFKFNIISIDSNYLCVTLKDHDKITADDKMAEFEFPIETFAIGETIDIHQQLPPSKKSDVIPVINLQVFVAPKGATPWQNNKVSPPILSIDVIEAKDVPKMDAIGKTDSYITMKCNNSTKKYKTSVVKNSLEPTWNQHFDIRITSVENDSLILTLKDEDVAKNDVISSFSIKFSELECNKLIDKWVDFESPKDKSPCGKVHLSYVLKTNGPTSSAKIQEQYTGPKVLNFKIVEAKNLIAADLDGKSDPYCKFSYGDSFGQTGTIKNTLSPRWDYTNRVDVKPTDNVITFEIYDDDIGKDDCIGKVIFKISSLILGNVTDKWYPLTDKKDKKGKRSGELHVILHLAKPDDTPFEASTLPNDEMTTESYYYYGHSYDFSSNSSAPSLSSWKESDSNAPSLADSSSDVREKRHRQVPKGAKKSHSEQPKKFTGYELHVRVIEAVDIPRTDLSGGSDPYVVVTVNDQKVKTKVVQNCLMPKWNEAFKFKLLDRNSDKLKFVIYDSDLMKDDEIAHLKLSVRDLQPGRLCDQWFVMKNRKGKKNTQIHLLIHLSCQGDRPFFEKAIPSHVLNVIVVEAAEVPKADLIGKSDPYCKLGIHGGQISAKTSWKDNTDSPNWSEQFQIALNDPATDVMDLQLWDHDVKNNDQLSETQIAIGRLPAGKVVDDWWNLEPCKKGKKGGRVHLRLQVTDEKNPPFEEE